MEFTCSLLNIKLTEIFKVKFCTNYEKFIHFFPNFRKISLLHISQTTRKYTYTYTYTLIHSHKLTHTHTNPQHSTCLQGNIFKFSYPFLLLAYNALVKNSRKYPHTQLQLYRSSNTTCCTVPCMTFIDVL